MIIMEITMTKGVSLTLLLLIIAGACGYGCVSTLPMAERLTGWQGLDVNQLLLEWGPPTTTQVLPNGNTMHEWQVERLESWCNARETVITRPEQAPLQCSDVERTCAEELAQCSVRFVVDPAGQIVETASSGSLCNSSIDGIGGAPANTSAP
jgi:hypothetical protein